MKSINERQINLSANYSKNVKSEENQIPSLFLIYSANELN